MSKSGFHLQKQDVELYETTRAPSNIDKNLYKEKITQILQVPSTILFDCSTIIFEVSTFNRIRVRDNSMN